MGRLIRKPCLLARRPNPQAPRIEQRFMPARKGGGDSAPLSGTASRMMGPGRRGAGWNPADPLPARRAARRGAAFLLLRPAGIAPRTHLAVRCIPCATLDVPVSTPAGSTWNGTNPVPARSSKEWYESRRTRLRAGTPLFPGNANPHDTVNTRFVSNKKSSDESGAMAVQRRCRARSRHRSMDERPCGRFGSHRPTVV